MLTNKKPKVKKDKKREDLKNCSLYNESLIEETLNWAENLAINPNNIQIIHDLYFHDLREQPQKYTELDSLYLQRIKSLVKKAYKSKKYDYLIIMSDHGPRIPAWKSLDKDAINQINNKSPKFINNFEIFYSVFKLKEGSKSEPRLYDDKKDEFYHVDNHYHPIRIN